MPIDWKISTTPIPYPDAIAYMQNRVAAIRAGTESEQVWLLEHPSCYTAGTSAQKSDLIDAGKFPVYETGRGGQYTYHGPGQRIAYVMLDLQTRHIGIRDYVCMLEKWVIQTLEHFGIQGELRDGRIGVWVTDGKRENKIAALGVRISRGVAFHGISINIDPQLEHFKGIIPCGIQDAGITSMAQLGIKANAAQVDKILQQNFAQILL